MATSRRPHGSAVDDAEFAGGRVTWEPGATWRDQDSAVTYLHYGTLTEEGSSGSPVFDQDWKLVGLHHAACKSKKANEGIRIERIVEAMRRDEAEIRVKLG